MASTASRRTFRITFLLSASVKTEKNFKKSTLLPICEMTLRTYDTNTMPMHMPSIFFVLCENVDMKRQSAKSTSEGKTGVTERRISCFPSKSPLTAIAA